MKCILRSDEGIKILNEIDFVGELTDSFRNIQSLPLYTGLQKPEIDKTLAMDAIERAQNEWTSPILFPLKRNRTLQICVDS